MALPPSFWRPTAHPLWPPVRVTLAFALILGGGAWGSGYGMMIVLAIMGWFRATVNIGRPLFISREECQRATAYLEGLGWVPVHPLHAGWLFPLPHLCVGYRVPVQAADGHRWDGRVELGFPMVPAWGYAASALVHAPFPGLALPRAHVWPRVVWWCWRRRAFVYPLLQHGGPLALHQSYRADHGLPPPTGRETDGCPPPETPA